MPFCTGNLTALFLGPCNMSHVLRLVSRLVTSLVTSHTHSVQKRVTNLLSYYLPLLSSPPLLLQLSLESSPLKLQILRLCGELHHPSCQPLHLPSFPFHTLTSKLQLLYYTAVSRGLSLGRETGKGEKSTEEKEKESKGGERCWRHTECSSQT